MSPTFVCPACGRSLPAPGRCPVDGVQLEEARDALLGRELGSFRIARVLGRGGMGTVYAGVHRTIGSEVAIKVIAEEYARNAELLERFFREARSVNMIRHEGIVNILDLARLPDGRSYITMELLEGKTLRDLIRVGPLPLGGLVNAMIDVLDALGAAHAIQIIHRDLKPDNVFLSTGGRTKVLDFGIAKLSSAGAMRTQTGVVLGTPEYMAPEQISSGASDERTDLYAIGVMLFEGVTGRRPFDAPSDFELMRAHVSTPPPRPSTLRADLPPALEDVILCALAKDPADRFGSTTEMIDALRYVASTLRIDQWLPLMPKGRLMTPRPPNPPASGPFVYTPRSPSPSATTRMRPQLPPGHTSKTTVHDLPGAGRAPSGPKIPGPTQPMIVPPRADRDERRTADDAQPRRHERQTADDAQPRRHERWPRATPGRRPRWRWIAGAGVAVTGVIVLVIASTRSEPRAGSTPTPSTTAPFALGRGQVDHPADYDPGCFDAITYLPRAQRIATTYDANAELVSLTFVMGPSGCGDIRDRGFLSSYMFRTSTGTCLALMIQAPGIQVVRQPDCGSLRRMTPRCTVADVLRHARPRGLAAGTTAVVFASRNQWLVNIAGVGSFVVDHCNGAPVGTPSAAVDTTPPATTPAATKSPATTPVATTPAATKSPATTPVATTPAATKSPATTPVTTTPPAIELADPQPGGVISPYDVIATKERYDPKNFDVRAFYPRAVELARARLPDAKPVRIILSMLTPDGAIALTASKEDPTRFIFHSASLTRGRCSVLVTVYPDRVETRIHPTMNRCPRTPTVPRPRCSGQQLRARGHRGARLELHADGWGGDHVEFLDDCE